MNLPQKIFPAILAYARAELPIEGCGLIARTGDRINTVVRMTNLDHSNISYQMDPRELLAVFKLFRKEGKEPSGIFHSHPGGFAWPSRKDVELAYYPEPYLIIGLPSRQDFQVRAFRIQEGKVEEEPIRWVPADYSIRVLEAWKFVPGGAARKAAALKAAQERSIARPLPLAAGGPLEDEEE